MADIADVLSYFCTRHPHPESLSNLKMTRLVYLADWRSAIKHASQITSIEWFYGSCGPYVRDIADEAQRNRKFRTKSFWSAFGGNQDLISLKNPRNVAYPTLTEDDKTVLDEVIAVTQEMTFNRFIEFVYGTFPIHEQGRYTNLDLVELAKDYQRTRKIFVKST